MFRVEKRWVNIKNPEECSNIGKGTKLGSSLQRKKGVMIGPYTMKHGQGFLLCSCSKGHCKQERLGGNVKSGITQFNLAEKVRE